MRLFFYQENFGVASPFVAEALLDWIHSLGEELVVEAMKHALERNKTSWVYVKSILKAWDKKGIRTVRDAEAEQVAFEKARRKKSRGSGGFFAVKEDIVPDWYEEEKRRQKEVRERKGEKVTQKEVEVLLREYLGWHRSFNLISKPKIYLDVKDRCLGFTENNEG